MLQYSAMTISPTEYFGNLSLLLDLEAEAEKQEALRERKKFSAAEAEASGNAIINLVIREEGYGLGGRFLLGLGKRNQTLPLPWTKLGVGSPIILSEENSSGENGWRGIVSAMRRDALQIALNQFVEAEADQPTFRLDRAPDEIARLRQKQALEAARSASTSRLNVLRDVLIGSVNPLFEKLEPLRPFNSNLNQAQVEAIQFALSAEDFAILHGPPGTGKTTTLIELIRQIVQRGESVLAVAPSNLAIDNLLERLVDAGAPAVRLGHPARVSPKLQQHTLDLLVENHPEVKVANQLAREAYALRDQSHKFTRAKPERGAKQAMREEAQAMLKEARQIETQITEALLNKAQVVCATLTSLDGARLNGKTFDWCVVDEASQSVEPATWIPLQFAKRLVLAGDPCQLPPTVLSPSALRGGFNISLMERLLTRNAPHKMLNVQYRMHLEIMQFSAEMFYGGNLQADETLRAARLADLPNVAESPLTATPVHFIDTAGANYDEELEPDEDSRRNPLEAELVVKKLNELIECGVAPTEIAIISPYSAQVKFLREKIKLDVEIDSVDGFQGREKMVVIVSLVRSNREGAVGFLADTRRMNVALTRAKRKLIVIGDSSTIAAHPFYEKLVKYFEAIGAYHSVWEE
ncbi:MAG: AAA family ATPase [Anaerolineales bacterium]|nr:AAA family ATPase [Anaerolineales bacterium]